MYVIPRTIDFQSFADATCQLQYQYKLSRTNIRQPQTDSRAPRGELARSVFEGCPKPRQQEERRPKRPNIKQSRCPPVVVEPRSIGPITVINKNDV